MRRVTQGLAVGAALLALTACEGLKQDLGIGVKRPPDEFSVYTRAPLSLPPDYALRPPAQAGSAATPAGTRDSARQAMLTGAQPARTATRPAAVPAGSPGLQELLAMSGAAGADSDIRAQVNRETTILAEADQSFVERLMFWSDKPDPATIVDPAEEARRIQQNQAMNKPLTEGETPTIRRAPRALLEGIFN